MTSIEPALYVVTSSFLLQKEKPLKRLLRVLRSVVSNQKTRISLFNLIFTPPPSANLSTSDLINIFNLQKDERSPEAVFLLQIKFSDSFYCDKPWNVSINIE